jgi:NtrC-family two-component system sensor histidine kinase KinB
MIAGALVRSLRGRFVLSGSLVVLATIASAAWSGSMFFRLGKVVDDTLRGCQEIIDLAASLASALEREDDALLLFMAGRLGDARHDLGSERKQSDAILERLTAVLRLDEDRAAGASLGRNVDEYRARGDRLVRMAGASGSQDYYHQVVNPALRNAVADCARLREGSFRAMQAAGLKARDGALHATWVVAAVAGAALILSTLAALYLARTVLGPISLLTESVDALRLGDFERRVPAAAADELGRLADGFNRMAGSLAAFRRTKLGEVLHAKEMLEGTLRALPDAVIVVGRDERVEAMNPTARAVFKIAEPLGAMRLEDLPLPPEGLRAVLDDLRSGRSAASADLGRAFSIPLDERRRLFLPVIASMTDSGAPQKSVLVLRDVTDFHRLDELRTELIGVTSHELKTPLTTLRMNLLLLAEKADSLSPLQREMLATAAQGCEELSSTIDRLLDLTRIEAGQLRIVPERVDLRGVVEHAAKALRGRFAEARITLESRRADSPALVLGDPMRLGIVISNLLTNALKYTSSGGRVSIEVSSGAPGRRWARIRVTDSGRGIPFEFRERVFEKFFRVEHHRASTGPAVPGAGIGLYLCRQIIEAHGGTIACQAGPDGRGTRFTISLPALFSEAEAPGRQA